MNVFQTLRIVIGPSPGTNDHEVRFVADGLDLIDDFAKGSMGLDPDDILLTGVLAPRSESHIATIARCDCGVLGCGDVEVRIGRIAGLVTWHLEPRQGDCGPVLRFQAAAYDRELERATTDTSWETPDRTAARLCRSSISLESLASNSFRFLWASGRVHEGEFTVSLELAPGPYQVLVSIPWRSQTPAAIASEMVAMLETAPESWLGVRYSPQRQGLGGPPIAGPGWRAAT